MGANDRTFWVRDNEGEIHVLPQSMNLRQAARLSGVVSIGSLGSTFNHAPAGRLWPTPARVALDPAAFNRSAVRDDVLEKRRARARGEEARRVYRADRLRRCVARWVSDERYRRRVVRWSLGMGYGSGNPPNITLVDACKEQHPELWAAEVERADAGRT